MKDIDIIKELEKEIGESLEGRFETDENGRVVSINLSNLKLKKIPENLLKLNCLKVLDLSNNKINNIEQISKLKAITSLNINSNPIKKIDALLNLNKLRYLYCEESFLKIDNFINFLINTKQKIAFDFLNNWTFPVFPREALNHNLILGTPNTYIYSGEPVLFMNNYDVYPPSSMIELGYRNPQFYYNNYLNELISQYKLIEKRTYYTDEEKENKLKYVKNKIITELLKLYYKHYNKIKELPFAIHKIFIYNYYNIQHMLIDNISENKEKKEIKDPNWIFITGENGYGKTLLLKAITIALFGNTDGNQILSKKGNFYIEFNNEDKYTINEVGSIKENYSPFQNFAAYGPARLNKSPRPFNDSKTNSLFNTVGELLDIEERLIAWEKDEKQNNFFKSAKEILLELLKPQVKDIIIDREGTETIVKYKEFKNGKGKTFDELASGYRSIISMVGDIMIRLSKHQSNITDFRELAGIVIIDEIDLHLHPKWQKAMVETLSKVFPKIQFIASTHSPIPILGAPENTVIINVQRNENGSITAQKLDIDFRRLMPNSILSSPIFNFDELIANSKPEDKFPHTEDSYQAITEKEKLKKELSDFFDDEKTKELLNLLNTDENEED